MMWLPGVSGLSQWDDKDRSLLEAIMTKPIQLNPPKKGSKLAGLVSALQGRGTTIVKLSDKLGWQPHTVRAAMTRLRQRGYVITRNRSKRTGISTFKLDVSGS